MQLSSFINISLSSATRTVTQKGFGVPLLMGYHNRFSSGIRTYDSLAGLVSDGFATHHPIYKMASAMWSQGPGPQKIKVGSGVTAYTHTQTLTMTTAVQGAVVSFNITVAGVTTPISYTIGASATTSTVATAVAALIAAVSGCGASAASAVITVTGTTAGTMVLLSGIQNAAVKDTTSAAGYDTALNVLVPQDDDFYFVVCDCNSTANANAMATWAEARTKIYVGQTQNAEERDGTGTLLSTMKAAGYERTAFFFTDDLNQWPAAAMVGVVSPKNPFSYTWKFKNLAGVVGPTLTSTQENNLLTNNCAWSTTVAGVKIVANSKSVGGRYMDERRGVDWATARIMENVFAYLANTDKAPFTNPTVDVVVGIVLNTLQTVANAGGVVASSLSASGPDVATVSTANKANRVLPDIKFAATLQGAVESLNISGTLSV
jgi:hypothetical protein